MAVCPKTWYGKAAKGSPLWERRRCMNEAILRVEDIQKYYGNKGSLTKAVDHITF